MTALKAVCTAASGKAPISAETVGPEVLDRLGSLSVLTSATFGGSLDVHAAPLVMSRKLTKSKVLFERMNLALL